MNSMQLSEKLISIYPELANIKNWGLGGPPLILIQDDNNGSGAYIKEWNYHQPQPTPEQLED